MKLWRCKKCNSYWNFYGKKATRIAVDFEHYPEYVDCSICRDKLIDYEVRLVYDDIPKEKIIDKKEE
jgi:rubredoxin